MHYRSDWPELGLNGPLSDEKSGVDEHVLPGAGNNKLNWVSETDKFESKFYGIPILNLHLEIRDYAEEWIASEQKGTKLSQSFKKLLQQYLERPHCSAYVTAKVVQHEPLCQLLNDAGFRQIEHRCLYKSKVSNLQLTNVRLDTSFQYQSLATIAASQRERIRVQILEICNEAFQRGYSRHFADRFLLRRATGLSYILNVMKLNFEQVPLHLILLALVPESGRVCGFSVLSERQVSGQLQYTQLLSAVRKAYRGRGVYAGLTHLLKEILPDEAQLINITHAENRGMQRAYHGTGRQRYADTLVLRRVFGNATQVGSAQSRRIRRP